MNMRQNGNCENIEGERGNMNGEQTLVKMHKSW
jgi:hypothetical protein